MVNSRNKGARREREVGKYLTSLGFSCKRMGRNGYTACDLDYAEDPVLSKVWIECKGDESFDLHTASLDKACEQAIRDAQGKPWAVLWKLSRRPWRLTVQESAGRATYCGDAAVKQRLIQLSQEPKTQKESYNEIEG